MNPDEFEEDFETIEDAMDDCGYDEEFQGVCWHVGTEHCSFWCPFHQVYFEED